MLLLQGLLTAVQMNPGVLLAYSHSLKVEHIVFAAEPLNPVLDSSSTLNKTSYQQLKLKLQEDTRLLTANDLKRGPDSVITNHCGCDHGLTNAAHCNTE